MNLKKSFPQGRKAKRMAFYERLRTIRLIGQGEKRRLRIAINQQAKAEAREISRNGGPSHASVEIMLKAMEKNEA